MPAGKPLLPRLPDLPADRLSLEQQELIDAIRAGPRGEFKMNGPFACYLHAPIFGQLAQRLGAHCRYATGLEPRLTELAILTTAQLWKAQYEWAAHEPIALQAGLKASAIRAVRAGRAPRSARKDERAVWTFVRELYRTRRVSDRTYKQLHAMLGDAGMVELVGLLGYYGLVAMTLNVFRMMPPDGTVPPFREPGSR